jgi:hypothetical protein
MKLVKNVDELRDLAIVYLTRANGSVHDAMGEFEKALFEASPVLAALFAGPNEALRTQIAVYLDGIQSDLAYLFQEGIARDEAIRKEREITNQSPLYKASIHSLEDAAKRAARIGLGEADERQQRP